MMLRQPVDRTGREIHLVRPREQAKTGLHPLKEYEYVSLHYSDDYFRNANDQQEIKFAMPVSGGENRQVSSEIEEKISTIYKEVENMSKRLERTKHEQYEKNTNFVSRTELERMQKKLLTDMEEDIFVAGKRHGIF